MNGTTVEVELGEEPGFVGEHLPVDAPEVSAGEVEAETRKLELGLEAAGWRSTPSSRAKGELFVGRNGATGGPTLLVAEAPRRRVTGWAIACEDHGAMPALAPSRSSAVSCAAEHLESHHGAKGRVVLKNRSARRAR